MTRRSILSVFALGAGLLAGPAHATNYTAAPPLPVTSFPLYWGAGGQEAARVAFAGQPIQRDRVVFFYEHLIGEYPRVFTNKTTGVSSVDFGGIPQKTNFDTHLAKVRRDVAAAIPDPQWDGFAILDFESWHPNWERFSNQHMKALSYDWVLQRFPRITPAALEARAHEEFERAGMDFMLRTLAECKALRPKATWGFYGYPYYYPTDLQAEFLPLFNAVDALFPDVYLTNFGVPDGQAIAPGQRPISAYLADVAGKLAIARAFAPSKPVYAIGWFRYHEMNTVYEGQFLNDLDLASMLRQAWAQGAKGMIFWDVVRDAATRDRYNAFFAGRGAAAIQSLRAAVAASATATSTATAAPPVTFVSGATAIRSSGGVAPAAPSKIRR